MAPTSRELAILDLIVHELRTPLAVATGSLPQALARGLEAGAQQAAADRVSRALENLAALTEQLRAWSRIGDTYPRTPVNVAAALTTALRSGNAGDRGINFATPDLPADVQVMSVRERLIPALTSVLAAVVRSAPSRSTVRVDITVDATEVRIAVGDFSDLQESDFAAEFVGGLGAALPLARATIESDGGRIWSSSVDGRVVGIGLALPRA